MRSRLRRRRSGRPPLPRAASITGHASAFALFAASHPAASLWGWHRASLTWSSTLVSRRRPPGSGRPSSTSRSSTDRTTRSSAARTRTPIPGCASSGTTARRPAKNRLHIDLDPDDQEAEVRRILALGARRADIGPSADVPWIVLAEPKGTSSVCCGVTPASSSSRPAVMSPGEGGIGDERL
ncbi:VOC family protein [Actinomadura coerulea]|uniref:VOC family protein n=1 Tax=Actinomadura coerulea TaxID=46159 RepID=UPI001609F6E9